MFHGQKSWSSHTGISTRELWLARASPSPRRSQGLSVFVVDNPTPGLGIRLIRSVTGEVFHYEVFFDSARGTHDDLLGKEGERLAQLLEGLDTDRFWGRFYKAPALRGVLGELVEYANTTTRDGAPLGEARLHPDLGARPP